MYTATCYARLGQGEVGHKLREAVEQVQQQALNNGDDLQTIEHRVTPLDTLVPAFIVITVVALAK